MKQQVNYCIVLSAERLKFLAESKYGIDRMKILHQLIRSVSLKETEYNIKGFHTTIHVGQAAISEVELSNRLRYDKKTISRLLDHRGGGIHKRLLIRVNNFHSVRFHLL